MPSKPLCSDAFWNTTLTWYSDYPAFTDCFKQTVLVWIPAIFLLLSTIIYFKHLLNESNGFKIRVSIGYVYVPKLLLNILLIASSITTALAARDADTSLSLLLAPIIKCVSFILAIIVCEVARRNGVGNPYILTIYWMLMVVSGIIPFYSKIIEKEDTTSFEMVSFYTEFSIYIAQFLLSNFNDKLKSEPVMKKQKYMKPCPQIRCSFISFVTYHWITALMFRGNKKDLEVDDLWYLSSKFKAEKISKKFKSLLRKNVTHLSKKPFLNLFSCIWKCYGLVLMRSSIIKFFVDTLELSTSLLLKLLLDFVSGPSDDAWKGYFYAILLFSISIIKALLNESTTYYSQLAGMILKTGIITSLYDKTIRIAPYKKKCTTNGEILNFMGIDAERICLVISFSHLYTSSIFLTVTSLSLMYYYIGWPVLTGVLIIILSLPFNTILSKIRKNIQGKQFVKKDARVKALNEIFSNIKTVKLYGWETPFADKINVIRNEESRLLKLYMLLQGATFSSITAIPSISLLVIFLTYTFITEGRLTAATAFVVVSLFGVLNSAVRMLPSLVAYTIISYVSMKRLAKFYAYEDREEYVEHRCSTKDIDLEFTEATLSYGPTEKPILKNISLEVKRKSLNIVIGAVGSGKSSLLSALLGDMCIHHGSVGTNGTLAYTSQNPWIQTCTIKENIIFRSEYSRKRYKKVLEACALKPDLEMLSEGENTVVGEKGITLSGGQKHRISLARAVYDDADIYLFDDPLSAVDSHVGKHLFENVLSSESGILRKKTRFLITHNLSYLSKADQVIFMVNGEMHCCGKYEELLEDPSFAEFVEAAHSQEPAEESKPLTPAKDFQRRKSIKSMSSFSQTFSSEIDLPEDTNEVSKEKISKGTIKLSVFIKYLKAFGITSAILCFFCLVTGGTLQTVGELILSSWTTDPLLIDPKSDLHWKNYTKSETIFAVEYGGIIILQTIFFISQGFFLAAGSFNTSTIFHRTLLYRIIKAPMRFFDVTPIGLIINRFSRDIDVIDETILLMIPGLVWVLVSMVWLMIIICTINAYIILLVIGLIILFVAVQRFYGMVSRQVKRLSSVTKSPIYSNFSELFDGVTTIKTFRKTDLFLSENYAKVDENNIYNYASFACASWLGIRIEFLAATIILVVGLISVIYRDPSTAGIFGLVLSRSIALVPILGFVVRAFSDIETNSVSIERIVEFTEVENEAEHVLPKDEAYCDWPEEGEIRFNELSCKYRDELKIVLNEINFTIQPLEKIGIIGRTGSGKSTLTLALFRLYEACNGEIRIDGVNIKNLGLNTVRSRMTILPQDAVLFADTVRFNLDPFNQYTDEQIYRALEQSQLKEFVEGLDDGLSHLIEEGGKNVSVGQRQLFCLARALLRKSKILVLDEATAAIDVRTDSIIQSTIREQFSGCTILTIAHRLNTILDYDRIMVLDKGKLVQFDKPNVLAKDKDNLFYKLLKDAQLQGEFEISE